MKPMLRKSNLPLFTDNWLTDFFDTDRFFDSDWLKRFQQVPAVNVMEKEKEFEIQMAAPGLTKKDFNITIENGILTIEVEKDIEKKEELENYTRREYSYTNFTRSFTLPESVKTEKVDAWYENGILRLLLPKMVEAQVKPKAIEVH
ncbi:MAG: Hsp20/alpha crystallin family protein [Cyclobacteriaceae bacterium]